MKKTKAATEETTTQTLITIGTKPTDVETAGLSGQVKQVMQSCYKARSGNNVKGKVQNSDYREEKNHATYYNEKGNKTEQQIFHPWSRKKIAYNLLGMPVEETTYYLDGDVMNDTAKVMNKTTMKYDANGNILEQIQYDSEGKITSKILSQNDDKPRLENSTAGMNKVVGRGNMIEQCYYQADVLTGKITQLFDDQGRMIESCSYDAKGLVSKVLTQYDDKGNVVEKSGYNATGLTGKMSNKYKYNKEGVKVEYTTHNYTPDGRINTYSDFTCNEHGDTIEGHHYDAGGNPAGDYSCTHEYDEQGNLLKSFNRFGDQTYPFYEEHKENLKSETEECVNDPHGNWIKKTTYYSSSSRSWKKVPVLLYLRQITYWGEEEPATQQSLEVFFADMKAQHDKDYREKDEQDDNQEQTMMNKLTEKQREWLSEASQVNEPFP
ncbi:MAG TPA: hypothetical protein VI757_08050, partial [Bacteroidia bacterium]|nr:hypothetical protein [Bacteroidia bacterium]